MCDMPRKPHKPSIEAEKQDKKTCFSDEDAARLYEYIRRLEEGYDE